MSRRRNVSPRTCRQARMSGVATPVSKACALEAVCPGFTKGADHEVQRDSSRYFGGRRHGCGACAGQCADSRHLPSTDILERRGPDLPGKMSDVSSPRRLGPMSLTTIKEVRPWVRSIKPGWPAGRCRHGMSTKRSASRSSSTMRRLSEEQIDTIVKWVDAGRADGQSGRHAGRPSMADEDQFRLEENLGPPT